MSRYTSTTASDRKAMLDVIGAQSVDDLFAEVPSKLRLKRELDLPAGLAEMDVLDRLTALANKNRHTGEEITFTGAGFYDHYVPAVVEAIVSRSEFQTSYTPYQPEVSQGNLQAIFEFQTAISELVALPVANASLYDGPTAAAEAAHLAISESGKRRIVVSRGLSPQARQVLTTYSAGFGCEIVEAPLTGGSTDMEALQSLVDEECAAVLIQQPNFLGAVEELGLAGEIARSAGALFACACDPMTLGVLAPPGEFGADIAFGEGQALGNGLSFGGPSFGFFAASERHMRRLPGRIAGETVDVDGRRGFVLTLQTREQHIRRERATSNICTNQALCALAGVVYLSWLGRQGIAEIGELMLQRTAYTREKLAAIDGVELLHEAPVVREFAVRLDADVGAVLEECHRRGVAAGHPLARDYPEYEDGLLIAITERRTKADIDLLASALSASIQSAKKERQAVKV